MPASEVIRLPELADDPDAVFVEDTALLLDGHAVITRPGAASRQARRSPPPTALAGHFELHRIESGFVDGGDVLRIGRTLYVGLSTRTDADGHRARCATSSAPLGYEVVQAELRNCLHLKTGATFAGPDAHGTPVLLYTASVGRSGAIRRRRTVPSTSRARGCELPARRRPVDPAGRQSAHRRPPPRPRLPGRSRSTSPNFRRPKPGSPA